MYRLFIMNAIMIAARPHTAIKAKSLLKPPVISLSSQTPTIDVIKASGIYAIKAMIPLAAPVKSLGMTASSIIE